MDGLPYAQMMFMRIAAHGGNPGPTFVMIAGSGDPVIMALTSTLPLRLIRYGLPALLILTGFVILLAAEDSTRWDGWAMCVGSGLALLMLNALFRLGWAGDEERTAEQAARDYLTEHGHWPDEEGA